MYLALSLVLFIYFVQWFLNAKCINAEKQWRMKDKDPDWPRPLPPIPRGFHFFIWLEILLPVAYLQFPKSYSVVVQEECEKWPFQSFIYNPKAREWPAEEAIGAWTPAANETLGARFFSSYMNAYIPRATTQQVTCAGGFLSSVRSQNSTSQWRERHILQSQSPAEPVHRREELRCITVLCTGDHWARWHCVYQCAGVLLKRHMLHSQVSAVSTESLWQNKHDLLRCGNCHVIS